MVEPQFRVRFWQRFHVRVSLVNGAIVFAILTAVSVAFYESSYSSAFEDLRERLRTTVQVLASSLDADALAALDPQNPVGSEVYERTAARLAKVAREDPELDTVYILAKTDDPNTLRFVVDTAERGEVAKPGQAYDAGSVPVLRRGLEGVQIEDELTADAFGLSLSGCAPLVRRDGTSFGLVGVDVLASRIAVMRERILFLALGLYGGAAALLTLAAFVMGRRIRGPIATINVAAGRIATGDFEAEIPVVRKDEFGLMSHHFNAISKSLKERDFLRDTFGRYVSPDIARRVLQDRSAALLGGEERDVTVVFSDIEGYSTMSELISPQEVLSMLNTYLGAMNEVIDQHDGCILEFLGDAILTVFNAPNDVEGHAERGVRCALAMRERLSVLNKEWYDLPVAHAWRAAGKEELRARIGIHTGRAVAGNLGSRTRMKYGVIGDVVNVAARIEALNKKVKTTVLISADTMHQLGPELAARGKDVGAHEVKGRAGAVQVFAY